MSNITVVDSIMGSGKTFNMISHMFSDTSTRYIFVTPFIKEIERIKSAAENSVEILSEDVGSPMNNGRGKLSDFKSILKRQNCPRIIAITHSLFLILDEESLSLLRNGNWTLVIDEAPDLIKVCNISSDEINMLIRSGIISIENGKTSWDFEKYNNFTIPEFKELSDKIKADKITCYQESILIEQIPPTVFREIFNNIYILTYLFDSNLIYYYFRYHNIEYQIKSLSQDGNLQEYRYEDGNSFKHLINIYEGKLNTNFPQIYSSLSKSWFNKPENSKAIQILKNNVYNYFRNITNSNSDTRLWTTFESQRSNISGKGYGSAFLPCNSKATNEYSGKSTLCYVINRYMNPVIKQYFQCNNISVNSDSFALSQMIQWIWRSQIRDGKPIDIYIPSERMRVLLYQWLG